VISFLQNFNYTELLFFECDSDMKLAGVQYINGNITVLIDYTADL